MKLHVECENLTGNLNGIQRDYTFIKEVISESDDTNPPPLPTKHPPCRVHSELIDINPSMIPNDGERVVLLSLVSRVEKNVTVKNEVMVKNDVTSGRLFQLIYQVDSNINLLQIILSIFLQIVVS